MSSVKPVERIGNLEDRFVVNGRGFNLHVVSGDVSLRPTMIATNDFDVVIFTCPPSPSPETLDAFHEAVLHWVMRHRGVAALAAREP